MTDDLSERVVRLETQMMPLLNVPEALARLEGKVDQVLTNGKNGKSSLFGTIITVLASGMVALLVVILTHALGK